MSDAAQPRSADPLRAALILVVCMLAWQLGAERTPSRRTPCVEPRSTPLVEGVTRAVVCDATRAGTVALRGPGRLLFGLPLDVNREPESSLLRLPGIGPARARAIVAARCVEPFRNVADLAKISGIGPVTVRGLHGLAVAREIAEGADGAACGEAPTLEARTPRELPPADRTR